MRPTAIHLVGVDNMSTDQVRQFVRACSGSGRFKVEWINDSSCKFKDYIHVSKPLSDRKSNFMIMRGTMC